ncbi:hypothetical protein [Mesorhizobium sp. M1403]|uniref:hypothetical protein n=1 Tax=Mesorhizobium sp. M1403 TaxID=2957097 RepID=UPI00333B1319
MDIEAQAKPAQGEPLGGFRDATEEDKKSGTQIREAHWFDMDGKYVATTEVVLT